MNDDMWITRELIEQGHPAIVKRRGRFVCLDGTWYRLEHRDREWRAHLARAVENPWMYGLVPNRSER